MSDSPIVKYMIDNPGHSFREYGRQLGVSDSTVRAHWAKAGGNVEPVVPDATITSDLIPMDFMEQVKIELVEEPIRLTGDCAIAADFHAPLFSVEWVNDLVTTTKDLRRLFILGDFNNQDALSKYFPKQANAGKEKERVISRSLLDFLLRNYEEVVISPGNHDDRLIKAQGYRKSYTDAIMEYYDGVRGIDRLTVTNLDHVWNYSPDSGWWYMCHPQAYSTNPLTGARQLSEIKGGCNVVTAHSHHAAVGYAKDGEHVVAEIGGLFDAARTDYLNKTTTYAKWVNGFGWIRNGQFGMRTPHWSM